MSYALKEKKSEEVSGKSNLKQSLTHAYVILAVLIVACTLLTYIIPSGSFERVVHEATGKTVIDPSTFQYVDNSPVGLLGMLLAVPKGMKQVASIIFFIFIIGGAFEVLTQTGFTLAIVGHNIKKFQGKEWLLFPIIVIMLACLAATMGLAEEIIIFIPILMVLSKAMGGDELTAVGLAYCGARAGHINGMLNPFSLGTAQSFAELPLYSGLWYRSIWFVITIIVTTIIVYRYTMKIKRNPEKSIMYNPNKPSGQDDIDFSKIPDYTRTHKILGLALVASLALTVFGVFKYGWYINEIAAVYLGFGILFGLIARFPAHKIADYFLIGAKNIAFGALIVGVARGLLVVLQDGQVLDTITHFSANLLSGAPKLIAVNGMYVFQWILNILIPSGSGQAATTMPLMIPISDILEINRQVTVTAFHYGDGVTNILTPTSGALMACLAVGKVPYSKWVKWVVPMLVAWSIIGFSAVTIAQMINLGPF
ncbi:YfcC family protein [Acidaminobacter sp. JC074]|uniref:YfcC family protein n=1 Tax=Acidaminobacter sp. JC074 TaxID=2530199 RepID=UPI001F0E32C6|nr:AbgT family transporter [Acidaminobacter sp. JC074]